MGKPSVEPFVALDIPEEWVEHLMGTGYDSLDKIKALEKPGHLHQEMMGYFCEGSETIIALGCYYDKF